MSTEQIFAAWQNWLKPSFSAIGLVSFLFAAAVGSLWKILQNKKNRKKLEPYINRNTASQISAGSTDVIGINKDFLDRLIKQIYRKYVDFSVEENGIDIPATKYFTNSKSDYKCFLILAGSGFGKTSLMIKLHLKMESAQLFGLAKYSSFDELNEEISSRLKMLNQNTHDTILLLDGFDEYPVAWKDRRAAFNDLFSLQKKFSKVVITCRNTFYEQGGGSLNPEQDGYICIKQLKPYNEEQIRKFLKLRYTDLLSHVFYPGYYSARNLVLPKNPDGTRSLLQIFQRPLMINMIDELRGSDMENYHYAYSIYKKCTDNWCDREASEKEILYISDDGLPSNIKAKEIREALPNSLQQFMLEISELMYKNKSDTVLYSEVSESSKLDVLLNKPANFSLLVRYNDHIQFCHRSFFEFFLAELLYKKTELVSRDEFNSLSDSHSEALHFYYQKLWLDILDRHRPPYLEQVSSYEELINVSEVTFSSFDKHDRNIISRLKNVTELYYHEDKSSNIDLNKLLTLSGMNVLRLDGLHLKTKHLRLVNNNNPQLQILSLRRTKLSGISSIETVCSMQHLKNLDISKTPILHNIFQQESSAIISILSDLFTKGLSLQTKNDFNSELLTLAAHYAECDVIQFLVKKGADLNAVNDEGSTALMAAAKHNKLAVIRLLVDSGADINVKSNEGGTSLMIATQFNTFEAIKYLVENDAIINEKMTTGVTALMIAAQHRNLEIIRLLIKNDADINISNNEGGTALILAVEHNKFEVIKCLIANGADVNAKFNTESTPLMFASQHNTLEVTKFLIERGADVNAKKTSEIEGDTALFAAAKHNKLEVVKFLIENGADINANNVTGTTPLMLAVQHNTIEVLKFLVENGADVNATQTTGATVLIVAANHNTIEVIKFLVENGANVNAKKDGGWNALMTAIEYNTPDIIECFINYTADINAKSDEGSTALTLAAQFSILNVIRLLIDKGADINSKTNQGSNALTFAAQYGTLDVIQYLLANGAEINSTTKTGSTALTFAAQHNKLEIVKCLVESGADLFYRNQDGHNAFMIAELHNRHDIADYLKSIGADKPIHTVNSTSQTDGTKSEIRYVIN